MKNLHVYLLHTIIALLLLACSEQEGDSSFIFSEDEMQSVSTTGFPGFSGRFTLGKGSYSEGTASTESNFFGARAFLTSDGRIVIVFDSNSTLLDETSGATGLAVAVGIVGSGLEIPFMPIFSSDSSDDDDDDDPIESLFGTVLLYTFRDNVLASGALDSTSADYVRSASFNWELSSPASGVYSGQITFDNTVIELSGFQDTDFIEPFIPPPPPPYVYYSLSGDDLFDIYLENTELVAEGLEQGNGLLVGPTGAIAGGQFLGCSVAGTFRKLQEEYNEYGIEEMSLANCDLEGNYQGILIIRRTDVPSADTVDSLSELDILNEDLDLYLYSSNNSIFARMRTYVNPGIFN